MNPFAGRLLAGAALVIGCAVAATLTPLWTYAVSLALFGLPHVLVELRYVDERFAARLPRRTTAWLLLGLVCVAALRALTLVRLGDAGTRVTAELLVAAASVALVLPLLARSRATPFAVAVALALIAGAWFAPVPTLVSLALLHNLTPVGFLAERLRGPDRRRGLAFAALAFGAVPAVMLLAPSAEPLLTGPLSTGHLDDHLPAFVPGPLLGSTFADRLFAAAAYLQCMHYAVVLGVLPRLSTGERAGTLAPWPPRRAFGLAVLGLGAVAALGFALDFVGTRSAYAMFAAVHAWIEIPVLVLACGVPARSRLEALVAT